MVKEISDNAKFYLIYDVIQQNYVPNKQHVRVNNPLKALYKNKDKAEEIACAITQQNPTASFCTVLEADFNIHKKNTDDIVFCKKCGKPYFKKDAKHKFSKYIIKHKCVYSDSGYGDYDEFADVEYLTDYEVCPHCNNEHKEHDLFLREIPGTHIKNT